MSKTIAILGRQPAIGITELESLYGADKVHPAGNAAIIDLPTDEIEHSRLGGTVKLAKLLTTLPYKNWKFYHDYLVEHVPKHTCCIGPGKLTFGISVYGVKTNVRALQRTGLEVKKAIKNSDGRPVRLVPNKDLELNSAQVLHNKLAKPPFGMELLFVRDGDEVHLAQTESIQDIDAYAERDHGRPKRDSRVGMLPPKLAQVIINLANPGRGETVLDPFCGTGVIVQEARISGYDTFGSDVDPRMINFTKHNLKWLQEESTFSKYLSDEYFAEKNVFLEVGDATSYDWKNNADVIACETYLGRPFSSPPDKATLNKVVADVDTIHKKFLRNVAQQTKAGFRMCIAAPAWKTDHGFKHLPTLDHLEELGYNRLRFSHASDEQLIYHRPGQIVARELVVLIRK